MIDISQFSDLQKKSKNSFAKQRKLMKKVMAGQTVLCEICQQPLALISPEKNASHSIGCLGIRCSNGCTDIQLDFV